MTQTAEERFNILYSTLSKERNMEFSECNQDHFNDTLRIFKEAGKRISEHTIWRDTEMPQEMISILTSWYCRLNPWKYQEYSYENDPSQDPEVIPDIVKFPDIRREELEIMAAREHVQREENQPIKSQAKDNTTTKITGNKQTNIRKIDNKLNLVGEVINFEQLTEIMSKHHDKETLRKQCERKVKTTKEKELKLPIKLYISPNPDMNYAIIKIPQNDQDIKNGILFQKIAD